MTHKNTENLNGFFYFYENLTLNFKWNWIFLLWMKNENKLIIIKTDIFGKGPVFPSRFTLFTTKKTWQPHKVSESPICSEKWDEYTRWILHSKARTHRHVGRYTVPAAAATTTAAAADNTARVSVNVFERRTAVAHIERVCVCVRNERSRIESNTQTQRDTHECC